MEEEDIIPDKKVTAAQSQEIYNEFKTAIRNQNFAKVQDMVHQYQKELDLINRIDPQSRQISIYVSLSITDEKDSTEITQFLVEQGNPIHIQTTPLGANFKFKD